MAQQENFRESPGAFVGGSQMTERDLYLRMISHLGEVATCARGMAQSRKDIRWMAVAGILDELVSRVKKLMVRPGVSRMLILPSGYGRMERH